MIAEEKARVLGDLFDCKLVSTACYVLSYLEAAEAKQLKRFIEK